MLLENTETVRARYQIPVQTVHVHTPTPVTNNWTHPNIRYSPLHLSPCHSTVSMAPHRGDGTTCCTNLLFRRLLLGRALLLFGSLAVCCRLGLHLLSKSGVWASNVCCELTANQPSTQTDCSLAFLPCETRPANPQPLRVVPALVDVTGPFTGQDRPCLRFKALPAVTKPTATSPIGPPTQ